MRNRILLLILFLCALAPSSANADDTIATLGVGGLIPAKNTQIVMESEDLMISVHKITVRYVFRNTSDKDIDALVEFPLPDLDGPSVYNVPMDIPNSEKSNFVDFEVMSGGKPIPTKMESRAFLNGQDITARLRSAGVLVSVLLEPLNAGLKKLSQGQKEKLENEGLIIEGDYNPPLRSVGSHGWWATWTMRIKFYWKQHFPAHGNVTLVQTYRPSVGGGYFWGGSEDGTVPIKEYCASTEALRRIAELQKLIHPVKMYGADITLNEREIVFILTTGNNWKGPIRHFQLVVQTDSSQDIVLTCMPGLKRIGATRYEVTRTNFHPASDLKLMILQPNKQTSISQ
ncbi:MAG TPA: DUF4424 family protein [Terriglobia bacterium]|nr:DUF4424 family protein [Terriglobia bacterium]